MIVWVKKALSQYATFSGRAQRSEYWFFFLFFLIAGAVGSGIDSALAGEEGGGFLFSTLVSLGLFLPMLSVMVRRLHDTGKSGWWFFIQLVPLIGWLWLLYLMVIDSEAGANAYGPNPKA